MHSIHRGLPPVPYDVDRSLRDSLVQCGSMDSHVSAYSLLPPGEAVVGGQGGWVVDRVGGRVGPLAHSAIPGLEVGVILSAPPRH